MPNFCAKVWQHVLMQKFDIFSNWIFKIILGNDLGNIFLIDPKYIVSLINYHEKYHFLLKLFSYVWTTIISSVPLTWDSHVTCAWPGLLVISSWMILQPSWMLLQLSTAVSCCSLQFPAVSCCTLQFPAVSCCTLQFPAVYFLVSSEPSSLCKMFVTNIALEGLYT